ncbi:MAG: hypothetical protein AUG48_01650 [Actinobacteria bacterium 13_1_20CM_3_68_9]|nr:MAG: hypothetical protein AUG48_01650 [Actinobacteria bacterium 13_1_20CM_3_68_9]
MTGDAAKRFRELVAAGHEIPYDVQEPGNGSPLPLYVPLTERFVRDHAPALLELDSFGSACAAIESAELAAPYLERFGVTVPSDARKRAELAGTFFLYRLWMDSTDFSLDANRLGDAITELELGGEAQEDEIEVVVPLRGLQMPLVRLELATATIVRADTVDVPSDARASEGTGTAGWEPTFLAAARVSASDGGQEGGDAKPDVGARAVEAFRQLITALRLFQAGGVGLGPYAWTRAGANRWRRIATGAGRPRRGGYRLAAEGMGELTTLSRVLAYRSIPFARPGRRVPVMTGALIRAISRFEAGLERNAVLEALNDYLLALRFVLEGGGPADLGLPMRVAALCAEPEQRSETKAIVDRALALERELWSGEPASQTSGAEGIPTAAETAVAVEDLARAILRDAACGHLGGDLRSTADEILLADGLAVGEGEAQQRGGSEEWDLPPEDEDNGEEDVGEDDDWEDEPDEDGDEDRDDVERDDAMVGEGVGGLRRVAGGPRGGRRRRGYAGPRGRGSNHDPVTPRAGGGQRVRKQPDRARRSPDDRQRHERADSQPLQRASRCAAAGAPEGDRPRVLSLSPPGDDRVGRERADL